MRRYCVILFFVIINLPVVGQSDNDNMENAEELRIGEFVDSFTDGNTIQRDCIDESLTDKCIKYHNDQWFTFNSGEFTSLYINISNQNCRDLYGVQLIALEGELCQPETYSILNCISLATQDDIFVTLNDLKQHQKYWLIIDGYLHDFCKFDIEVSETPMGLSSEEVDVIQTSSASDENIINLSWHIPDSAAHEVKNVHILKRSRGEFRYYPLDTVGVSYNAYGSMKNDYHYADTLIRSGQYHYRVVIEDGQGHHYLNSQYTYKIYNPRYASSDNNTIELSLDYRRYTSVTVLMLNAKTQELVDYLDLIFDPREHAQLHLFTNKFLGRNIDVLEVQVVDNETKRRSVTYHKLTDAGQVKR